MMSASRLWEAGCAAAVIAVLACAAGVVTLRLLAGRTVRTSLAVTVALAATLAGVVVAARGAFLSGNNLVAVLAVVLTGGLAGVAVSFVAGRRVSRASSLMLAAVQEVGESGQYHQPTAVLPGGLAALSSALETAHARLAEVRERERTLEAGRRELVAWVSHDLRAPLAGLRAMAEALEDGVITDQPTIGRYHKQIRKETDRLTFMIDDLFELSRLHADALRLTRRPAGLGDLIGEALTCSEPLARANGVELRGHAAASPPVLVDTAQLARALGNLMTNAIRHTPADGFVEVVAGQEAGMAMVSVSDSCGGIPADCLPRVFDVAFRDETAQAREPDGGGLGLSIARGIIEAHSGQIGVHNTGPGCQFVIRLPLASCKHPAGSCACRESRPWL